MKRHLGLALAAAAALAFGGALAQPSGPRAAGPQEPSAIDRLNDLEKQVAQLQAQLDTLRKAPPKPGAAIAGAHEESLATLRRQMDEVLAYLAAQAQSAKLLQQALEESREKGFTYGINPDSRIVLLTGFGQFTSTLQANVPETEKPAEESSAARR